MATAPCSAADLTYLAGKKFYDNTKCHEITAEGALHCGDPSGTGLGGPTYSFYNENVPATPTPAPSASAAPKPGHAGVSEGHRRPDQQPAGHQRQPVPIFFKDYSPTAEAQYPIVGTVTGGLDTLDEDRQDPHRGQRRRRQGQAEEQGLVQTLTVGAAVAGGRPPPPSAPASQS